MTIKGLTWGFNWSIKFYNKNTPKFFANSPSLILISWAALPKEMLEKNNTVFKKMFDQNINIEKYQWYQISKTNACSICYVKYFLNSFKSFCTEGKPFWIHSKSFPRVNNFWMYPKTFALCAKSFAMGKNFWPWSNNLPCVKYIFFLIWQLERHNLIWYPHWLM